MTVSKITNPITPLDLIDKTNEIIDGFLQNTATGTNALTLLGDATNRTGAINIGYASNVGNGGLAIGYGATINSTAIGTAIGTNAKINYGGSGSVIIGGSNTSGSYSVVIGDGSSCSGGRGIAIGKDASATANSAIQIGEGTNSTINSFQVSGYQLLNTSTGLIPSARLPLATSSVTGAVKPDNTTITIGSNGALSSNVLTRNIGEIVTSAIPLTDAGLHLLDGALISGSGSYSAFVTYIAGLVSTYPDLFETEANWQQSVTDYGVCGKFVYDSVNNTVRLPKITGIIEGTTDLTALLDLVEAGLPNITGNVNWVDGSQGHTEVMSSSGALYKDNEVNVTYPSAAGRTTNCRGFSIDASLSSSIYGNSTTVQPQTIKVLYYIVIATSTKTDIQVDIDEIATDLNGKADVDLTNCTKPHITETYKNGASWYRVYSDGWCEQGGVATTNNTWGSYTTVTFLKNFGNTSYSIIAVSSDDLGDLTSTTSYNDVRGISMMTCKAVPVSVSSFALANGSSKNINWQASGYIS